MFTLIKEATIHTNNYFVISLSGDMGGEIGLMLGASLLTFVEFIDLLIFLIYHQFLRLYKKKRIDNMFDEEGEEEDV